MSTVYFQFSADMYTQATESVYLYVNIYSTGRCSHSLVAVLTARGFHVKGRSLISEKYVPACPPQTHFIALLPSAVVPQGNASDNLPRL